MPGLSRFLSHHPQVTTRALRKTKGLEACEAGPHSEALPPWAHAEPVTQGSAHVQPKTSRAALPGNESHVMEEKTSPERKLIFSE